MRAAAPAPKASPHGLKSASLSRISIVAGSLNDLQGLRATFCSIRDQLWRPFQWIVADGGSANGVRDWLSWTHFCEFIIRSDPDEGICDCMDKGLGRVEGDYAPFLSSGDWSSPQLDPDTAP